MARKNLIGVSDEPAPAAASAHAVASSRPIAGFVPPPRAANPVGGITKSLSSITSKMERAQDLEKQLAEGQSIIELDPASIDASFVSDRLALDGAELAQLADQIRENGQQVPILVRPHPDIKGRYQVAYGHRRLAAVRQLGQKVRAVVRDLTDDQLVVSQGQENNARTNLSYIERALFASKLEDRAFTRDIIMAALGVDKAALSKMLSVTKLVPLILAEAIGPAPEVGRRRWMELAEKLEKTKIAAILKVLEADDARAKTSDERFQIALNEALKKTVATADQDQKATKAEPWAPHDKSVSVKLTKTAKRATIALEAKDGPRFAEYITSQLESLYQAFRESEKSATGE